MHEIEFNYIIDTIFTLIDELYDEPTYHHFGITTPISYQTPYLKVLCLVIAGGKPTDISVSIADVLQNDTHVEDYTIINKVVKNLNQIAKNNNNRPLDEHLTYTPKMFDQMCEADQLLLLSQLNPLLQLIFIASRDNARLDTNTNKLLQKCAILILNPKKSKNEKARIFQTLLTQRAQHLHRVQHIDTFLTGPTTAVDPLMNTLQTYCKYYLGSKSKPEYYIYFNSTTTLFKTTMRTEHITRSQQQDIQKYGLAFSIDLDEDFTNSRRLPL